MYKEVIAVVSETTNTSYATLVTFIYSSYTKQALLHSSNVIKLRTEDICEKLIILVVQASDAHARDHVMLFVNKTISQGA